MMANSGRSERHRQQRSKNLTLLGVRMGLMGLIYVVYIVRAGGGG